MEPQPTQAPIRLRRFLRGSLLALWVGLALLPKGAAKPMPDASDPLGFFTTVADQLLQSTFDFGVTNIPVYTNGVFVYSPSVQRLLQLSANLYDATTNSPWPSVFRPVFNVVVQGTNRDLFITDYTYVPQLTNGAADISIPADAATVAAANAGAVSPNVNIYGVPWIIGAKKGLPNFNRFDMRSVVQVTRKLQVTKPYFGATLDLFQTNQMYIFSVSNTLACALWNSYTSAYTGNLTIVVRDTISMALTNDAPLSSPPLFNNYPIVNTLTGTNWPGTLWYSYPPVTVLVPTNASFVIPLNRPLVLLTNSVYRYAGSGSYFDPLNPGFQTDVATPQLPQFGLLATNRLQVFILDGNHVIDYVHLVGPNSSRNLNAELADPDTSGAPAYLWSTNGYPTPSGVLSQLAISKGLVAPPSYGGYWLAPPNLPTYLPQTLAAEQTFFSAFFNYNPLKYSQFTYNGKTYTNTALEVQAPFTPTRILYDHISWQANDPLVHYLASDLTYNDGNTGVQRSDDIYGTLPAIELDNTTLRYSPWGKTHPGVRGDSAWLSALKDPLLWRSDNWHFPTGADWSLAALGRVHRGTPWQTVYLKASDILTNRNASGNFGSSSWAKWTGNSDSGDAQQTAPINDWNLVSLLLPLLSTNDPTQLLSVNSPDPADSKNALAGILVLTNAAPDFLGYRSQPLFVSVPMAADSPQAEQIANALYETRTALPAQRFESVGDLLRTPALTESSPWLNTSNPLQTQYAISDEAYEAIPAQLLPRLRPDSVGAVTQPGDGLKIRFSGSDIYAYALETSTDLIHWEILSTNYPVQGGFSVTIPPEDAAQKRFYRSVLLY